MIKKEAVVKMIDTIQRDIRVNGSRDYLLLLSICSFINSLFCDCKVVQYWVYDMNFGQNTCNTELGHELKGLDTIEKFVDYLFTKITNV